MIHKLKGIQKRLNATAIGSGTKQQYDYSLLLF
jgi:hypothetical protein